MFIQTESTPNPATLKFLPGLTVLESGSAHFDTVEEASVSPLAERLFEVEGVTGVFLGSDFITVHKTEDREWFLIKPSILGLIMEHFTAGRPVMRETEAAGESSEEDSEVVTQIKDLLDTRVRPAVAMDGGDREDQVTQPHGRPGQLRCERRRRRAEPHARYRGSAT